MYFEGLEEEEPVHIVGMLYCEYSFGKASAQRRSRVFQVSPRWKEKMKKRTRTMRLRVRFT